MSTSPPFITTVPPPLPLGWTEHIAPGGQIYYHNAQCQESTYIRPLPSFQNLPPPQQHKVKKEKRLIKTPIPGTEWIRVKTNEGHVFYSHKAKKQSLWTVPEEIKDAVAALEAKEEEMITQEELDAEARKAEENRMAEEEQVMEVQRIKAEVQAKRKADDIVPMDELAISQKKARLDDEEGEGDSDESEEEGWQREAAAQLAAEAEEKRVEEQANAEAEAKRVKEAAEAQARKSKELSMPAQVDLSIEEAKALFKTLLREKDINPLHPWDTSLPLFVSDPRYVLLPSLSARRDSFDEYCRDRARELRQLNVKKEKEVPKDAYDSLLKEEVKSTRTSWSDFRRTWKKDRRFYGWGRDDREREKRFREFVKDLGEKKRAAAQKAETDFFMLMRESAVVGADSVWKEVKRKLSDDPRYDAVGSSSLREELFKTFLKAEATISTKILTDDSILTPSEKSQDQEGDQERIRREKKAKAMKEREEKVKADRGRLEADIGRSRMGLDKEEGERVFRCMLTDAVRDPQITWDDVLPQLKIDPRFLRSPLPVNQQVHIFHSHIGQLRLKYVNALHALFNTYASSLATPFSALPLQSLLSSLPVTTLGLDIDSLEHEFDKWQRERTITSRADFDEMLQENAFMEFWGRLGKIGGEGVDAGVQADDLGEDEGEGGGGKVDMKALAKSVDVGEMEKVLRNDKRYIMFEHVPQQRERWIREHLSGLSAPKLTVHLQDPKT